MKSILTFTIPILLACTFPALTQAQMLDDLSDRYIRVAEPGELVDSLNVWGDVTNSGRYLVPEGTTIPEIISFSFGYTQLRGNETNIDWSKTQIEVKVSRYNENDRLVDIAFFRYRYHDPEPTEMFEFDLQNNDIITLQVRKKPSFTDYVNVVAPVVGVLATSILLLENLRDN